MIELTTSPLRIFTSAVRRRAGSRRDRASFAPRLVIANVLPWIALLMLVSCSGATSTADAGPCVTNPDDASPADAALDASSDGGAPECGTATAPGAVGDGGIPTLSCGDEDVTSIDGTWDIVASGAPELRDAVLVIDDSTFSFAADGTAVTFAMSGGVLSLVWQDHGALTRIGVTHQDPAPFSLGVFPLAVPGSWTFSSLTGPDRCSTTLVKDRFTGTCNGVVAGPFGRLPPTLIAQRVVARPSLFGEMGGVWQVTEGLREGSIEATFSGNTFTAVSAGRDRALWITMKVCAGKAVGLTSEGNELVAVRQ